MSPRHTAVRRSPRAHWLLFVLLLTTVAVSLAIEGWTSDQVDAAHDKRSCTEQIPRVADTGRPVLRFGARGIETFSLPPGIAAITFDGGPDPYWTPRLLDLLRRHHAHATFFVYGRQAARYPALIRRIVREGHEIGSYTYTGGDLGASSSRRASVELSLTQIALAGAGHVHTELLRLPHTTAADTLCGADWAAAEKAGAQGYLIIAADRTTREPAYGIITQYSQTDLGYREAQSLLSDPHVTSFTTVSGGLGLPFPAARVSIGQQLRGLGLIWTQRLGHWSVFAMVVGLAVAGALGVLRLLMLTAFARAHVRRLGTYRPGVPWPVQEPVTVLVPAYNEQAGIASALYSLLASTHRAMQVVVIDDGSTDSTGAIAAGIGDPRLTVIRQANAGKAHALNTGLAHARHGIVVMVDADTVFEPEALARLIQPLAHPTVGAVSGNTKVGNRGGILGRWQHLEYVIGFNLDRRMLEVLECMPTVPGAIGAFRREALTDIGGVSDETLAEDTDLTMALWRAGWRVVYQESAVAWTEVPASLGQLWRQRYRWCYGTLQAMWKHRRALIERGPSGRFGRRALPYLALFQVLLPLCAPLTDLFALYGVLCRNPAESLSVWLGFLIVQLVTAAYALRLDRERLRILWVLPLQMFVYRQLIYLVLIQSIVTALLGTRLRWHNMRRAGTADPYLTEDSLAGPLRGTAVGEYMRPGRRTRTEKD